MPNCQPSKRKISAGVSAQRTHQLLLRHQPLAWAWTSQISGWLYICRFHFRWKTTGRKPGERDVTAVNPTATCSGIEAIWQPIGLFCRVVIRNYASSNSCMTSCSHKRAMCSNFECILAKRHARSVDIAAVAICN